MKNPINIALWLLPWLILASVIAARIALPVEEFRARLMGELGPIELGTVVILAIAIGVGLHLLRQPNHNGLQKVWFVMVVLGCVYFAGEEMSWGQHLVGWSTPDSIAELNDQQETNLHNMSSWLDQKPRLALELWMVFGALLAIYRWLAGPSLPLREPWIWALPGLSCASAGVAVLLSRLPERLGDIVPALAAAPFDIRLAEVQELLIGVHLLSYLWFAHGQSESR
ncbi:MAG: hypothetical protein AB8B96_10900 [Lysobacterales bacterium]